MKVFLFEVAILSLVALFVASYFFRSQRAKAVLWRLRLAGWAYVGMVLALAALQLARHAW
jgi:hypothetical protein